MWHSASHQGPLHAKRSLASCLGYLKSQTDARLSEFRAQQVLQVGGERADSASVPR